MEYWLLICGHLRHLWIKFFGFCSVKQAGLGRGNLRRKPGLGNAIERFEFDIVSPRFLPRFPKFI